MLSLFYAECRIYYSYSAYYSADCIFLSVEYCYYNCYQYAKCHYAECRCDDSHGDNIFIQI